MPLIPDLISLFNKIKDPDAQQRQAALAYYAANPNKYQELADSNMSSDPAMLQQIFGQNARFGGNSGALDTIRNNLYNTPMSPGAQVQSLSQLGQTSLNDISDASKNVPQLKGVNANTVDLSKIGQGPEALLSDQQKDIRRKFLGLPTQLEQKNEELLGTERQGNIDNNKLQQTNLGLENTRLGIQNQLQTTQLGELKDKIAESDAKKARATTARVFMLKNKKDAYQTYLDKATPQDVRQGLFEDPALKDQFDKDMERHYEEERLALQKYSVSSKHDMDYMLQQHRAAFATTVGTKYGTDPQNILNAMKLGKDLDKYADPNFKPTNDADAGLHQGAVALKASRESMPAAQIKSAYNDFRTRNQAQFEALEVGKGQNRDKPGAIEGQSIVNQVNQDANVYFGSLGIKPPQWTYTESPNDKGLLHTGLGKKQYLTLADPGDPDLGLATDRGTSKNTKKIDPDQETADQIIQAAKAGQIDFDKTMKDPRTSANVRKLVLQKYKGKQ